MIETVYAGRWIHQALSEVGLSRHPDIYSGRDMPYILYSYAGGSDSIYTNRVRALVRQVWRVEVIGVGNSYGPLKPYADRVDAALHGATNELVVDGVYVSSCLREQVLQRTTVDRGVTYRHLGGEYVMYVSPPLPGASEVPPVAMPP